MNIPCDILLKHTIFLNKDMGLTRGKSIVINGGYITAITGEPDQYAPASVIDGSGLLWMPGLVDGHTHTSQQFLRGRLLDEKPVIWKRINVPFESSLDEQASRESAEIAALEMIKNGTTAFVDAGGKYVSHFADVYDKSGLRARLTYMTNDNPGMPDALRVSREDGLSRLLELRKTYGAGRIQAYCSVTALTAASEQLFCRVFSEAKELGIPIETHMNEYSSEVFDFIERYGVRPFEYLEQNKLLGGQFLAAHCLFLSPREIDIIKNFNIPVIHCPFSNCGKGIPDTPQLLARGVSVGFGSDGSAHGGLDLFKEIRLFRGIMNASRGIGTADPGIMPAETLLWMATAGGAGALMQKDTGLIAEGYAADLIAVNIDQPHIAPTQNLVHTLVESVSGNDVRHMIVAGRQVMKDRNVLTLDEEKILAEVRKKNAARGWYAHPNSYY